MSKTFLHVYILLCVDYKLGNNPLNVPYMLGFIEQWPGLQTHHHGTSIPTTVDKIQALMPYVAKSPLHDLACDLALSNVACDLAEERRFDSIIRFFF